MTKLTTEWSKIDKDANNELSRDEINAALKDRSFIGESAAVLGALKVGSRAKDAPPLTRAYFDDYAAKASPAKQESVEKALDSTTDPETQANTGGQQATPTTKPAKGINWDRNFTAARARIEKNLAGTSKLWDPELMTLESTRQGQLGDCYFVSASSAILSRDKGRLLSMVKQNGDGTVTVQYPGRKSVTMEMPTEAQLALGGVGGGAWLPVMEQAWGKWRSQEKGKGTDVEGTDGIAGGDSGLTLQILTGHKYHRVSFPNSVEDREAGKTEKLKEAREWLIKNIAEKRAITAGTLPRKVVSGTPYKTPPGIVKNHVYVIADYDAKTDVVTIWNPHGNKFSPKGSDGLENGYATEKGMFKIPLAEAYSFYTSFTFETDEPVELKTASTEEK